MSKCRALASEPNNLSLTRVHVVERKNRLLWDWDLFLLATVVTSHLHISPVAWGLLGYSSSVPRTLRVNPIALIHRALV